MNRYHGKFLDGVLDGDGVTFEADTLDDVEREGAGMMEFYREGLCRDGIEPP